MRKRDVGGAALAAPKGATFEPDLADVSLSDEPYLVGVSALIGLSLLRLNVSKNMSGIEPQFESLILAQDERWRQA